ncbi:hypothetical protein YC2023_077471 [Brassica napus]
MPVSRLFPCRFRRRLLLLSFGRDVREMREVVCHVLDHLREEGPQTTTRRRAPFAPRRKAHSGDSPIAMHLPGEGMVPKAHAMVRF